jgi:hypothetical protein
VKLVVTHPDSFGELDDSELVTVTDVNGSSLGSVHEENQTIHKIVDVLEGSGLATVTVHGHILALERLDDEVGDNSAVVWVHSWSEGVEDTGNPDIDIVLPLVAVGEGLGDSLAFVVTCSDTDAVDVTPVFLSLRVLCGITVYF